MLSGCSHLENRTLLHLSKYSYNLTYLNISSCYRIDDGSMITLIRASPKLITLNLTSTSITDASIKEISIHCKKIRKLTLNSCKNVSKIGILFEKCKELENLNIAYIANINFSSFELTHSSDTVKTKDRQMYTISKVALSLISLKLINNKELTSSIEIID